MNKFIVVMLLFLVGCGQTGGEFEAPQLGGGVGREAIRPEGEVTHLEIDIIFYDDLAEIREYSDDDTIEGWSECWRSVERNEAGCDIHLPRSRFVDDMHILTLGHEVAHGIWGPTYHSEVL